jgi:general L-amino acid transport system permease protein
MATLAPPERNPLTTSVKRPESPRGLVNWLRANLFRTWFDTILTFIVAYVALTLVVQFFNWVTVEAQWTVVTVNFRLLMQGMYPGDQGWRLALAVTLGTILAGASWGMWGRMFRATAILFVAGIVLFTLLPLAEDIVWESNGLGNYLGGAVLPLFRVLREPVLLLIVCLMAGYAAGRVFKALNRRLGGRILGGLWLLMIPVVFILVRGINADTPVLPLVRTNQWGGLMLTFMMAFVAIVCCFPLGIVLALGRMSSGTQARTLSLPPRWWLRPAAWRHVLVSQWRALGNYPIIKVFCTVYIEFLRGVPLVTVFFTASLVVPLALGDANIDSVVRAMIGLTLFQAAYIAEIVRGGLQALPSGQIEAARALGLNPVLVTLFITLPQALRIVIPALVGQFITMFKDTSLVAVISLLELLGTSRSVLNQPGFVGRHREVYVFVAIVYFVFSYGMSAAARQLERSGSGKARR